MEGKERGKGKEGRDEKKREGGEKGGEGKGHRDGRESLGIEGEKGKG